MPYNPKPLNHPKSLNPRCENRSHPGSHEAIKGFQISSPGFGVYFFVLGGASKSVLLRSPEISTASRLAVHVSLFSSLLEVSGIRVHVPLYP